jgi:[lysine-biosynthesis-protein LysW]--L-2-aminoadipate ligase
MLYTQLRAEENLLLEAAEGSGLTIEPIWDERVTLSPEKPPSWADEVDVALVRTLSLHRALALTAGLEAHGVRCVNDHDTFRICGDKWQTTLALARAGVPTPETRLATTVEEALEAAEAIGYPIVTKPLQGSWARGLAKANDPQALEGVLEQREAFGDPVHQQHYVQAHVDKPDRDVRAFVADDEVIAAIRRESEHWITNTARGAEADRHPLTQELTRVCREAAAAVGGGALAIDLMETPDGYVVHEVNARMEFRNSIDPTGVPIHEELLKTVAETEEVSA